VRHQSKITLMLPARATLNNTIDLFVNSAYCYTSTQNTYMRLIQIASGTWRLQIRIVDRWRVRNYVEVVTAFCLNDFCLIFLFFFDRHLGQHFMNFWKKISVITSTPLTICIIVIRLYSTIFFYCNRSQAATKVTSAYNKQTTTLSRYYAGYTGFELQCVFRISYFAYFVPSGSAGVPMPSRLCTANWPQIDSASHISTHVDDMRHPKKTYW